MGSIGHRFSRKRAMSDRLDQLFPADAVREGLLKMGRQFAGPMQGDQIRHGDEAQFARGEARPVPGIARQAVAGTGRQCRGAVARHIVRGKGFIGHGDLQARAASPVFHWAA